MGFSTFLASARTTRRALRPTDIFPTWQSRVFLSLKYLLQNIHTRNVGNTKKSSYDPNTAVRLGWSWQVYSERGCLLATVSAGLQRSLPVTNYVSDRLYSDSWTNPLEGIGPGLTNGYSLV